MKFNKHLQNIVVYEAGKPIELVVREFGIEPKAVIKMASNENPYGTPPEVQDVIKNMAHNAFRYPDDSMFELKAALAKKYGVESKNIVIGAGSDQVIDFAIKARCEEGSKILTSGVTFAMYEIYAKQMGAEVVKTQVPVYVLDDLLIDYEKNDIDLVFLCTPNNPLGDCLDYEEILEFLSCVSSDTLVVVDGAYQEYAAAKDSKKAINPKELIEKYPNTLYLGTFSKAYGLGGLRVGYGIGEPSVIEALHKVRPPFNITNITLAAAKKALECESFIAESIAINFNEMKKYESFLKEKELKYIESYTNFITILFEKESSQEIADKLLRRGIIVRNLSSYGQNGIRVTIDKPENNDRFLEVFAEILNR